MIELTIFSIPKGFVDDHVSLIQRNALTSWRRLGPEVEVLLLGDDPGVAEAAREFGITHIGGAVTNEHGTPLLDWAFRVASTRGSGTLICYVNADIVLLDDFLAAVRRLPRQPHLAIGQRWDCDIHSPLDFSDEPTLRAWVRQRGALDARRGSDYFIHPRAVDFGLPPFAVGRPAWDNWMIGRALERKVPLIDMTPSTTVVHQNHDYRHVAQRQGTNWEGPEAAENRDLAPALVEYLHTPTNATHVLTPNGLRAARSLSHLRSKASAFVALHPAARPLRLLAKPAGRVLNRARRDTGVGGVRLQMTRRGR